MKRLRWTKDFVLNLFNFRKQLVELYKMYYTLFCEKFQIYESYSELPFTSINYYLRNLFPLNSHNTHIYSLVILLIRRHSDICDFFTVKGTNGRKLFSLSGMPLPIENSVCVSCDTKILEEFSIFRLNFIDRLEIDF